jgi:AAA domain
VQIWDPDFESKFGGSLSSRSGGNSSNNSQLVDSGGRDTVNVLLCIDSGGMKVADDELGGWAPQGLIVPGLNITGVCALGNVLTSIRECQALMSLRSLSKSLQEVVLCGGSKGMQFSTAYGSKGDVGGTLQDGIAASTISSASNTLTDPDRLSCPETLPTALWKALSGQYNSSQLRAIHAVCLTTSTVPTASDPNKPTNLLTGGSSATATVTLLQGPPGTGKTRTVLAIVAALLAGGGSAQRRTGSKVRTCFHFLFTSNGVRLLLYQFFSQILIAHATASE